MSSTWTVSFKDHENTEAVTADGFQIGPNGDLLFSNGFARGDLFPVRAFAVGVWEEVSLYA